MDAKKSRKGIRILVTGSVLQLFFGIIYVWSVFVAPVGEHFRWDTEPVKLTSSFMLCCFVLGILIGGKLLIRVGASLIVLAGGLMMGAGILATSLLPASAPHWTIWITYGIMGGFGVGMAYNAIISCAQKWFPHKRGMATGVSVCMFGFSTVVFAPLVKELITRAGLIATLQILAAAFGAATLLLFRFIQLPPDTGAASGAAAAHEKKQYTTGEMLRHKAYYYITLSMMFLTASYFILNPSFIEFAKNRGFSDAIATVVVMMTGLASSAGRLLVPLLGDKLGRERTTILILAVTALSTASLTFATGALFMIAIALIAFCYGGSSGIYPVVTADYFGIRNIGSNYGAVMVGFMLSALFFPMLLGMIADITVKFIVLAALGVLGALMIVLLSRYKKTAH